MQFTDLVLLGQCFGYLATYRSPMYACMYMYMYMYMYVSTYLCMLYILIYVYMYGFNVRHLMDSSLPWQHHKVIKN